MHLFDQLVAEIIQDVKVNRLNIEHSEDYPAAKISLFFVLLRKEIRRNMLEAEKILKDLTINRPNIKKHTVEYNRTINRRTRDFLVVHKLIEELKRIYTLIESEVQCKKNGK